MPNTRHTETPWKVAPGTGPVAICDTIENRPLCRLVYRATNGSIPYTEIERGKANAAYIVTAVNAHDELVAALDDARVLLQIFIAKPGHFVTSAERDTLNLVCTTLRTAKGD